MIRGAVCVRCGGSRADFREVCPHCGHRPDGEGLLVAWLLSIEHLDETRLEAAAERIRAGEVTRPSERLLVRARKALGTHFSSDPGLTPGQRLGLLLTGLLLTPLPGWVLWAWWRVERPRAALQALGLALPASAVWFAAIVWFALA